MRKYCFVFLFLINSLQLLAHPMPASVVKLSVLEKTIKGEAKMPLVELESAIKHSISNVSSPFFKQYFEHHIRAVSGGKEWTTTIREIRTADTQDSTVGSYRQVIINFELFPPDKSQLRKFVFNYDVIMHEVITDKALVLLEQDWNNGIHNENGAQVVGMIKLDIPSGKIYPLQVSLERGSTWKGFISMFKLGMQHIKEGTDHLLFLIVLLLPSMLLVSNKRWSVFGGLKYSISNLLKVVTAFTIGHSITLLIGALGWVTLPGQLVEVLIACSILVSAVHAIYPIFSGRETYIAGGFGLIHGLAFANVLSNLDLSIRTLSFSILGFNLGIEIMQLGIILMIVPWLILLSKTAFYKWIRIPVAVLAAIAAIGWIIERITQTTNFISAFVIQIFNYTPWIIMGLIIFSLISQIYNKKFSYNNTSNL